MSKIVKDTENRLHSLVTEALGKAIADGVLPAEPIPGFKVEVPADRANGDYSVNAAFACARAFRTAPKKIADAVSKYIDLGDSYFESCSVAGPGFINFTLGDRYYADILLDIKECGEKYGSSDFGKNKKSERRIRLGKSHGSHAYGQRARRCSRRLSRLGTVNGRIRRLA